MDYSPRHSRRYQPQHLGKDESKARSMAIAALVVLVITALGLLGIQPTQKPAPKVMMRPPLALVVDRVSADRQAAQVHDRQVLADEKLLARLERKIAEQKARLADVVRKTGTLETRLRQVQRAAAAARVAPYVAPALSAIKFYALQRVGSYQFRFLDKLWTKESNWQWNATNPSSGAYGIPQALPGSKMSSAGSDWRTNPYTQIRWGIGYISEVYGSPENAWAHSVQTGWY